MDKVAEMRAYLDNSKDVEDKYLKTQTGKVLLTYDFLGAAGLDGNIHKSFKDMMKGTTETEGLGWYEDKHFPSSTLIHDSTSISDTKKLFETFCKDHGIGGTAYCVYYALAEFSYIAEPE